MMKSRSANIIKSSCILLGIWLILFPFIVLNSQVELTWSHWICGSLIILFGLISLLYSSHFWPSALLIIGIWLQTAPLIFWAQNPLIYLNDTLTGFLLILLSNVLPQNIQNQSSSSLIPDGWTYNPSSWSQRFPIIILILFAWMASSYMTAYQLGYLSFIWDPVFGENGTRLVITSDLSKQFPIPDAGLGALMYSLELIAALKGNASRWKNSPTIVFSFGVLVVPVGITSILLIISQPILVGHWCFWCLMIALTLLIVIALSIDEVIAALTNRKNNTDHVLKKDIKPKGLEAFRGVTLQGFLIFCALIGMAFMIIPPLLNLQGFAANIDYVLGALIITVSVISLAEPIRALRFLNILIALSLIFGEWLTSSHHYVVIQYVLAFCLIFLAIPRGKIKESYGPWDRYIF